MEDKLILFDELYERIKDKKDIREILMSLAPDVREQFKRYYDSRKEEELDEYYRYLRSLNEKDRSEILNSLSESSRRRIYIKYFEEFFKGLASLPEEERYPFLHRLTDVEREAFFAYLESSEYDDGEIGDGAFSLSAPKVLRPYKTLQERLGRSLTESLMEQASIMREGIREKQLARYDAMIEEVRRVDRLREKEEGFNHVLRPGGRGHH